MAQAPRRVAVTGLGLLTPLGLDTESTWDGLIEGRSGIAPITAFDELEAALRPMEAGPPPAPLGRQIRSVPPSTPS